MMTYTDKQYAKVALWLDDPYGDGIRLMHIRNPSVYRLAALNFISSGQYTIFNDEQTYIDIGKKYMSKSCNRKTVELQQILKMNNQVFDERLVEQDLRC